MDIMDIIYKFALFVNTYLFAVIDFIGFKGAQYISCFCYRRIILEQDLFTNNEINEIANCAFNATFNSTINSCNYEDFGIIFRSKLMLYAVIKAIDIILLAVTGLVCVVCILKIAMFTITLIMGIIISLGTTVKSIILNPFVMRKKIANYAKSLMSHTRYGTYAECLCCFDIINCGNLHVMQPCGHANLCKTCYDENTITKCPLCREEIDEFQKIYL